MNTKLQLLDKVLPFVSTGETVMYPCVDKATGQTNHVPELPPLQEILWEIGPLPEEALFFGLADDGLPVLLNINDPNPGPILVAADSQAGKTNFLKNITRYVISTRYPWEIQYGVITNRPHEWNGHVKHPHCVGIFSIMQEGAVNFLQALATWVELNQIGQQPVLFMVDGLDNFMNLTCDGRENLRKVLLHGPSARVWPVATVNLDNFQDKENWLRFFQTRIFGYTKHAYRVGQHGCSNLEFEILSKGVEYSFEEDSQWTRFRVPRA